MTGATWADLFTERDGRNHRNFMMWLMAVAVLFAAATILIGERFLARGPLAWTLTGATIVLSAMAFRAYVVFLRDADELLRKIHLEGLALGFGAGAVFMPSWRLLERLGAPKLDSNDALLVMMLFWVFGQWRAFGRYGGAE